MQRFIFVAWVTALTGALLNPMAQADVTLVQRISLSFPYKSTNTHQKLLLFAKGQRVRFEGNRWHKKPTIIQFDRLLILRLNTEKKTYIKINILDLQGLFNDTDRIVGGVDEILSGKRKLMNRKYQFEPSGHRDTIGNKNTQIYWLRGAGQKVLAKAWIAKDTDAGKTIYPLQRKIIKLPLNLLGPLHTKLLDELERIGGTAMRILLTEKRGVFGPTRTDIIVERIDRNFLDPALFEVPANYREETWSFDIDKNKNKKLLSIKHRLEIFRKLFNNS